MQASGSPEPAPGGAVGHEDNSNSSSNPATKALLGEAAARLQRVSQLCTALTEDEFSADPEAKQEWSYLLSLGEATIKQMKGLALADNVDVHTVNRSPGRTTMYNNLNDLRSQLQHIAVARRAKDRVKSSSVSVTWSESDLNKLMRAHQRQDTMPMYAKKLQGRRLSWHMPDGHKLAKSISDMYTPRECRLQQGSGEAMVGLADLNVHLWACFHGLLSRKSKHAFALLIDDFVRQTTARLTHTDSNEVKNEQESMDCIEEDVQYFIRKHFHFVLQNSFVTECISKFDEDRAVCEAALASTRRICYAVVSHNVLAPLYPALVSTYERDHMSETLRCIIERLKSCSAADMGVPAFFQLDPALQPDYASLSRASSLRSSVRCSDDELPYRNTDSKHGDTDGTDSGIDTDSDVQTSRRGSRPDLTSLPDDSTPYSTVINTLKRMTHARGWGLKAQLAVCACKAVSTDVIDFNHHIADNINITSDELIPIMAYCVVQAEMYDIHAQLVFLQRWANQELMLGEIGFCLATLQCAADYLLKCVPDDSVALIEASSPPLSPQSPGTAILSQKLAGINVLPIQLPVAKQEAKHPVGIFDRLADESVAQLLELTDSKYWKFDRTLENVDIFSRSEVEIPAKRFLAAQDPVSNIQFVKGEGPIPTDPLSCLKILREVQNRQHYDSMCRYVKIIQRVNHNTLVAHIKFKSRRLCKTVERDFCTLVHWRKVDKTRWLLVARSVRHKKCPVDKTVVRGQVILSGWILDALPVTRRSSQAEITDVDLPVLTPTDDTVLEDDVADSSVHTRATYMVQCDIGGLVPTWIKNMVAYKQPLLIAALRDFFDSA